MKNFYEVGKVYVWQNLTGPWAQDNGKETTVIGNFIKFGESGGQETDTPHPLGGHFFALKGSLRPKNPPSGEQKIAEIIAGKLHVNDNVKEIENV